MKDAAPGTPLGALLDALSPLGLNHVGVAAPDAYDAVTNAPRQTGSLLPETRSILVFASAGRTLWDAFVSDLRTHPGHLTEEAHPLDAFVRRQVDRHDGLLQGISHRWFFAAADAPLHLDFRVLGQLAGLGGRSRLGLLLHPTWGPWMGLRAALFCDAPLPPSPEVSSACDGCPAPCVRACPGDAFPGGQWAVDPCSTFHRTSDRCDTGCDARFACPVGSEERYSEEEILYHYHRGLGRERLRQVVAASRDRFEGEGPHWGDWRNRVKTGGKTGESGRGSETS